MCWLSGFLPPVGTAIHISHRAGLDCEPVSSQPDLFLPCAYMGPDCEAGPAVLLVLFLFPFYPSSHFYLSPCIPNVCLFISELNHFYHSSQASAAGPLGNYCPNLPHQHSCGLCFPQSPSYPSSHPETDYILFTDQFVCSNGQ